MIRKKMREIFNLPLQQFDKEYLADVGSQFIAQAWLDTNREQIPEIAKAVNAHDALVEAVEECDVAFVCINICDDLTPQARGAVRRAWALVQAAILAVRPESGEAFAIRDPETAYSILMRERDSMLNALSCARTQLDVAATAMEAIPSEAWGDVAQGCRKQIEVIDKTTSRIPWPVHSNYCPHGWASCEQHAGGATS